ncbi:MAG: hypothetical protein ABSA59_15810 [Terriglobia bacterium]
MKPKKTPDVQRVLEEFQEAEKSTSHRKGTFKNDAPFEKALDTILKVEPDQNGKDTTRKRT